MDTTTSAQHSTAAIDFMGPITMVHIVLMVVLALAALLVIWWGTVLRRRRHRAEDQVVENREIADETGATASALPDPAPDPAPGSIVAEAALPEQPESSPPSPEPTPPAAASVAPSSELGQLKGLGPKLAATLAELGYTRIEQIAALGPDQAEALDARLGAFRGRMARDRWIEQATLLTAGDRAGYEARFGKL